MAITMEEVRAALEPEELDYKKVAKKLGPEALPHLEKIITGDHSLLASKAAYMAGVIGTEAAVSALDKAARNGDVTVRIAAAAVVGNLPPQSANAILLRLVDDANVGVQKYALRSVPNVPSPELAARVEALSGGKGDTPIRTLSREVMSRISR